MGYERVKIAVYRAWAARKEKGWRFRVRGREAGKKLQCRAKLDQRNGCVGAHLGDKYFTE